MARSNRAGTTAAQKARKAAPDELEALGLADPGSEFVDLSSADTVLVTASVGSFQLLPSRTEYRPNGTPYHVEGKTLDFGNDHRTAVDEETAKMVEAVLAGEFDGAYGNVYVDPRVLQRLAHEDALHVVRPGLVATPMPTWNTLPAAKVVETAAAAGFLSDESAIEEAIKYEQQAVKRVLDSRIGKDGKREYRYDEPRDEVLADLKAMLAKARGVVDTDFSGELAVDDDAEQL